MQTHFSLPYFVYVYLTITYTYIFISNAATFYSLQNNTFIVYNISFLFFMNTSFQILGLWCFKDESFWGSGQSNFLMWIYSIKLKVTPENFDSFIYSFLIHLFSPLKIFKIFIFVLLCSGHWRYRHWSSGSGNWLWNSFV